MCVCLRYCVCWCCVFVGLVGVCVDYVCLLTCWCVCAVVLCVCLFMFVVCVVLGV